MGPSQAPPCTAPSNAVSSSAAEVYSSLSADHAPAADNNGPGPGPLLNSAEWTSGGDAIQTGAITATSP
ncbi:hypothetical protein MBOU_00820 [Mycobacterium bourgelatii]|uniref:Uncharacterized protein n=1 Tax=Mycobacterium bourgelatii TaxID=1273442 RepID=A0A7I9YH86_MYCBU|nr:hypothetical protein MBOU_00820 [Mycobacterium bourgelatii]